MEGNMMYRKNIENVLRKFYSVSNSLLGSDIVHKSDTCSTVVGDRRLLGLLSDRVSES